MLLIGVSFQIVSFCAIGTVIELAVYSNQILIYLCWCVIGWSLNTFFPERSCIRIGHHMQMVFAGAKTTKNVCNFIAKLSRTTNAFYRRIQGAEYGFLFECKYCTDSQSSFTLCQEYLTKLHYFFSFPDFQNHLFICDAHFYFYQSISAVEDVKIGIDLVQISSDSSSGFCVDRIHRCFWDNFRTVIMKLDI